MISSIKTTVGSSSHLLRVARDILAKHPAFAISLVAFSAITLIARYLYLKSHEILPSRVLCPIPESSFNIKDKEPPEIMEEPNRKTLSSVVAQIKKTVQSLLIPKPLDPILDPITSRIVEQRTNRNRKELELDEFLPQKILFYGPPGSGQEMIAEKMARDLRVKYHYFDGRKLSDEAYWRKTNWLYQIPDIYSSQKRDLVFVSHADELCRNRRINTPEWNSLGNILSHTGFDGEIFLCLGVSSTDHLDTAVTSRYAASRHIYIPLPGFKERLEILKAHVPKVFKNNFFAKKPSDQQLIQIAEKSDGLSGKSLNQVLLSLYQQKIKASEWTEEMIVQAINNQIDSQKTPLPTLAERSHILKNSKLDLRRVLTPEEIQSIAEKTEGFSLHMLWSMLLDISNTIHDETHETYTRLTKAIVDQTVQKWLKKPKEKRPNLAERIKLIEKYIQHEKNIFKSHKVWTLFTPQKIRSIAEKLEGISDDYIFWMIANCAQLDGWTSEEKPLTEEEIDKVVERWTPRPKGAFNPPMYTEYTGTT